MKLAGTIHKLGAHVDTDAILPGKYLNLHKPEDLGPHCLEGLDPTFATRVQSGDIIVAGKNFGTGSSREHAPIALKAAGVSCVVAESFARIFYRNAINIGLPIFECPELALAAKDGEKVLSDVQRGTFEVEGASYQAKPFAPYIQGIINAGGLVEFVKKQRPGNKS